MSWYTNLNIRIKLLIGFIFITCILIFIGVYAIVQLRYIDNNDTQLFEGSTKPLGYLTEITRDFLTIRINFRDIRTASTPQEIKRVEDAVNTLQTNLNKTIEVAATLALSQKEADKWNDFKKGVNDYADIVVNVIKLKEEGKNEEANEKIVVGSGIGAQVTVVLEDITNINLHDAQTTSDHNTATANSTITLMIIIVVIAAIISIIIAFYIARIIANPLKMIEAGSKHIAETGDLTAILDIKLKDEIGNVHRAIAQMVGNFGRLIKKVMTEIDTISKQSDGLLQVSEVTANASVELQAQTQTASSSSEEVSANVSTVASSVEELSASIKEIAKNTTAATALTKASEERANEASEVMSRLGQSSQEIGNIVKSITGIAEQTNLLALNATIEAARAGEMGKGFAVVANEVKELAKESAKATEDITNKIKIIQSDTKSAIDVIGGIIENITKINEITTSIASAVEEQSVTANEVNRNIGEATIGVTSIVEVITGIMQAVNDYTQQANKLKNTSSELQTLASGLDKEINDNFKV